MAEQKRDKLTGRFLPAKKKMTHDRENAKRVRTEVKKEREKLEPPTQEQKSRTQKRKTD